MAAASEVLSGAALLDALRGIGLERPETDPDASKRVRVELEAVVQPFVGALPDDVIVRVSKDGVRKVLLCERHLVATYAAPRAASPELVAGRLLDRVFGLVVTGDHIGVDSTAEGLGAALAADDKELEADWETLSAEEQSEVREFVNECSMSLTARWPTLPGSALIRLQEPLRVELGGGRIILSGRVDAILGRPAPGRAGSTLIDVKSGKHRQDDGLDAGWYAVLETLRHQAAPFQVGSYYLRDGTLMLEVVSADGLAQATRRIGEGLVRLLRLASGTDPEATPNPLCPWCPGIGSCEPGKRYSEERGTYVPPATVEDGEDDDEAEF